MSSSASPERGATAPGAGGGPEIEIEAAGQRAVVVTRGGGLRAYSVDGRDVLDGYPAGEPSPSGRGQVLIPWPNRLEDGIYEFDGRRHRVPVNEPERGNAIHGLVRDARWSVAEHEPHRVVVEHQLEPQPGYPFALSIRIDYTLSPDGLRVCTTATNVGAHPCPYGAGAHPYLTVGGATVDSAILRVPAGRVLRTDERGLPVGALAVDGTDHDFTQPRRIGRTRLDHAFTDLERDPDGLARAELQAFRASRGLTLWVDEAYAYLMVFTGDPLPDVNRRSIAIEPMTCPPNAFRTGDGVIRLEPGESFRSVWGITPP
ncbi:MAG TPA: aldose 1-epimerase family protein [Gaiellales bacterium]|nr:aldose 1-epimerase family protein [Gaiellales bacterium]